MTINELENELNEKLKSLGFLCYNKNVDSSVVMNGVDELLGRIENDFYYILMLRNDGADDARIYEHEERLNSEFTELGCVCYNIYVDGRMDNTLFIPLCEDISYLTSQIANAKTEAEKESIAPLPEYDGQSIVFEPIPQGQAVGANSAKDDSRIVRPYGMEPIPENYIQCSCGYRNRQDAVFCAKCGTRLLDKGEW